jgi:hypothetical protein
VVLAEQWIKNLVLNHSIYKSMSVDSISSSICESKGHKTQKMDLITNQKYWAAASL